MILLILPLFWPCLYASNVDDLTSFEERLTIMEQGLYRRLNTAERVLGQYLTGRNNTNLADLDIHALGAGT